MAISCQRSAPKRNFFKVGNYYSKELDSLELIKDLKIADDGIKIDGNFYWKINTNQESFFRIHGFIRLFNNSILLKRLGPQKPCEEAGDQILFSFNAKDLNQRWFTNYVCESPMLIGDSITLVAINYNESLSDTIYRFKMEGYYVSAKNNSKQSTGCIKVLDITKQNGFINGFITNSIDTIQIQFYPNLKRLNDENNGQSGTFNL